MVCADRPRTLAVSGFWNTSYLRLAGTGHAEAMTNRTRITLAAAVTALFLVGISAAGLAVRDGQPQAATTADVATATADKPGPREDHDVSAVVDAALAAASGKDPDVSAAVDAALAAAFGEDHDVAAVLDAVRGEGHDDDSEGGEDD
jgi:hypothetical protein